MKITEIKPILQFSKDADDAVIIEGKHGIGKSEIVKQYCSENGYFYTVLFLSHQEVGDLIGMPFEKNGIQYWSKPSWLVRMEEASARGEHNVLLLDELNRAQTDVLQSALQLVLERQIHEHFLPTTDGVRSQVIACINPDDDLYQVITLDPALKDRFLHLKTSEDLQGWVKWGGEKGVPDVVIHYLLENENDFHSTNEDGEGATPRSWYKLSQFLKIFEDKEVEEFQLWEIIKGKVGSSIGSKFLNFYNTHSTFIDVTKIKKFLNKYKRDISDLPEIGAELASYIKGLEQVTKVEQVNKLYHDSIEKIKDTKVTMDDEDIFTIFAMLHAFEIEVTTSVMKQWKNESVSDFMDFVKKDNKELITLITRRLKT